jgi:hypothetical protein
MECLRPRVKDQDIGRGKVLVHEGKADKDRVTMLPSAIVSRLTAHLKRVRKLHAVNLAAGLGRDAFPDALARKYPQADREWGRQWIFPALSISADPRTGEQRQHHLHESVRKLPSVKQDAASASQNRLGRTRCATASPRIC